MKAADRWFPLHIGDFVAGVLDLSRAEIGAYVLLLFHQWTSHRPIPADAQTLANITRSTLEEWAAMAPRILAKFTRVADGWLQLRLASERAKADQITTRRAAAGRAGAAAHWQSAQWEEPYLPGLEPVDNSPVRPAVISAAPAAELHNGAAETAGDMAKDSKSMANVYVRHTPVPVPKQDLFDQHARRTSHVRARVGHAHAHALRARACAHETHARAAMLATFAAREALRQEGVRVPASDPTLAALVAAGVPPTDFALTARQAIARGAEITSPAAWTLATMAGRLRHAPALETRPPPDWHATRASMDAHARTLGLAAWADFEAEQASRGIMPIHAEWLRAVEIADAAAARAQRTSEEACP
jgi:uncharacterized protein YdaU (DUF1376 family)